jgi:CO/xanthine dehydrogenase Mo-binding subunit
MKAAAKNRDDADAKASGAARYVGDISLPGMLHVALARSLVPHARIVHIDTSQAAAVQAAGLAGTIPGASEIEAVADAAEAVADPSDDQRGSARYKKAMAREWAARVLRACLDPGSPPVPGVVAG